MIMNYLHSLTLATALAGTLTVGAPPANAQGSPTCGTQARAFSTQQLLQRQATGVYGASSQSIGLSFEVPIAFHIVRESTGSGGFDPQKIPQMIAEANAAFQGSGISFSQQGETDFINDTDHYYHINSIAEVDALRGLNTDPHAINVYFVKDLAIEAGQLFGISSYTDSTVQGIVLDADATLAPISPGATPNHSTWAHELGHYFDLYHTHESFLFGTECVDGSNSAFAGDLVTDTPADPGLLGATNYPVCNWTGGPATSPCGAPLLYVPDTSNMMSAADHRCRNNFTPGQLDRAFSTLLNIRLELQGGLLPTPLLVGAGNGSAGDRFGDSVAVGKFNGLEIRVALIGAPKGDSSTASSGTVYVYEDDGNGWIFKQQLDPGDLQGGDSFGTSVAFDGRRAIIGAPGQNGYTGAAYIFTRDAVVWNTQVQKLVDSNGVGNGRFGHAVDIHDEVAIVGAPVDSGHGAAVVFDYDSSTLSWGTGQRLISASPSSVSAFGLAVSVSEETIVIGAPQQITNGFGAGSAYVFEPTGGIWLETAQLTHIIPQPLDEFGNAVSIWGNTIVVGAPRDSNPTYGMQETGSVSVFARANSTWNYTGAIDAPFPQPYQGFGRSVALERNKVIIGAPLTDQFSSLNHGAAYDFSRSVTGWDYVKAFYPSGTIDDEQFGWSVAVNDRQAIIGHPLDDQFHADAGSVWFEGTPNKPTGLLLTSDLSEISEATGGVQTMKISAGPAKAGVSYIVLGTTSGCTPGLAVPVGVPAPATTWVMTHEVFTIPLVFDPYFQITLSTPTVTLANSVGVLDANGEATVTFTWPAGLAGAGYEFLHAVVLPDSPYYSSFPVPLNIAP